MVEKTENRKHHPKVGTHPHIAFLFLMFILPACVFCDYPELRFLGIRDVLFEQLSQDIGLYYQKAARHEEPPGFQLFSYTLPEDASLFSIASKINLPYETIATLNRIEHSATIPSGRRLLIPNTPGLFVSKTEQNGLEKLITNRLHREKGVEITIGVEMGTQTREYIFYPGKRFSKGEMAYFLNVFFLFPIKGGRITSPFGNRISPFSAIATFHSGIDIAAPLNTEVTASRDGVVTERGFDLIFGKYIIISHKANYQTMYAHLDKITVMLHQQVNSGMVIGTVGNTGLSTGPHLHFEIRLEERPIDPIPLLPKDYR